MILADTGRPVYVVEWICQRRELNNSVYYLVKWDGYDEVFNTWEPESQLMEDCPDIVKQFESLRYTIFDIFLSVYMHNIVYTYFIDKVDSIKLFKQIESQDEM